MLLLVLLVLQYSTFWEIIEHASILYYTLYVLLLLPGTGSSGGIHVFRVCLQVPVQVPVVLPHTQQNHFLGWVCFTHTANHSVEKNLPLFQSADMPWFDLVVAPEPGRRHSNVHQAMLSLCSVPGFRLNTPSAFIIRRVVLEAKTQDCVIP